ncbi:MAG: hypothetical protein ACLFST_01475 [Spirochaetia bacterium]
MNRKDFILHLITELSHFLLDADPTRLVVSLHQEEDGLHLAVFDNNPRSEDELGKIRKTLNTAKRPELAGYYGSMTGYDMLGAARLDLVGWQVKHGTVSNTDSGTRIDLWLGGERFNPDHFSIPHGEG